LPAIPETARQTCRPSPVFAGSINQSGALEIRVERVGRDASYGKIIEAVEQAERSRAPVQRLAGYPAYFAIGAAVLTFIITRDRRRAGGKSARAAFGPCARRAASLSTAKSSALAMSREVGDSSTVDERFICQASDFAEQLFYKAAATPP